jgi:recombination associated protein RdgC
MGKKLEQARIYLAKGDYEWRLTVGATLFEYRNVSLPRTISPNDEGADPLAWEAKVLDRIGMSEEALQVIDELFRIFLQTRTSADWSQELARLKRWIAKGAEN